MEVIFSFEKLDVWQESRALVKDIYAIIRKFPSEERYALSDQIKRAVISIPSNIAEGSGRVSIKEKIHFTEIAYGSLMETFCQIQIARDLNYINDSILETIKIKIYLIAKMLSGMRYDLRNRLPKQ